MTAGATIRTPTQAVADEPVWPVGGTRIELYRTVLALAVTTMFVTPISAELYLHGPVRVRPHVFEPVTIRFLQAYTWNLVDSVPGLELTRTFNWTEPLAFPDPGAGPCSCCTGC